MRTQRKYVGSLDKKTCHERGGSIATMKRKFAGGRLWAFFSPAANAKIREIMDVAIQHLMSHPMLLTICLAFVWVLAIPLLLFIIFMVMNVAFVFTSFITIEVSVLTIGAILLSCIIFCVISIGALLVVCVIVTYCAAYYLLLLMKRIKEV